MTELILKTIPAEGRRPANLIQTLSLPRMVSLDISIFEQKKVFEICAEMK